jgi:hypothetical protein
MSDVIFVGILKGIEYLAFNFPLPPFPPLPPPLPTPPPPFRSYFFNVQKCNVYIKWYNTVILQPWGLIILYL